MSGIARATSRFLAAARSTLFVPRRHRPICTLDTNVSDDDFPKGFEVSFALKISEMLNKPINNVMVTVNTGVRMSKDGNSDATMAVHIHSIGVFDSEKNPAHSAKLYQFFQEQLDIPADRISVLFHPLEKHQAGHLLYAEQQQSK